MDVSQQDTQNVARALLEKLNVYLVRIMESPDDGRNGDIDPPAYTLKEQGLMSLLLATTARRTARKDTPECRKFAEVIRDLHDRVSRNEATYLGAAGIALLCGLVAPIAEGRTVLDSFKPEEL